MTLKQITKNVRLQLVAFSLLAVFVIPVLGAATSFAAPSADEDPNLPCGVEVAVLQCPDVGGSKPDQSNGIMALLVIVLQIMTAGVGVVAVGGIIYGGVLYASAGDSSERVKKAIEVIRNVIIGVVAYGVMFALLNFLIPGGVFT